MNWRLPKPIWEAIDEFRAVPGTDTPVPSDHLNWYIHHDGHGAFLPESLDGNDPTASLPFEWLGLDHPVFGVCSSKLHNDQGFALVDDPDRTLQSDRHLRTHVE